MQYLPYKQRTPDGQYRALLASILTYGERVFAQQDEWALQYLESPQLHFDLRNGFPVITERDLVTPGPKTGMSVFAQSLGELTAFLNGAHTQDTLARFGAPWWKRWVTPEKCAKRGLAAGDLGPGSYGPAWRAFPTAEGKPFDQITHLIEQIGELPRLRTHFVTPWIPQYLGRGAGKQQKVVVVPCHGLFFVMINTEHGTMDLHHIQRSGDVPVGIVANLIQYAALLMMIAQVTGYQARKLHYTIVDAHIFERQIPEVRILLATEPQRLPTVTLDPSVREIVSFRPEHFSISDYHPQRERMVLWTPI